MSIKQENGSGIILIIQIMMEGLIIFVIIYSLLFSDEMQEYKMICSHFEKSQEDSKNYIEKKYNIDVKFKSWEPEMLEALADFEDGYYFTYSYKEEDIIVHISNKNETIYDDYYYK
jgi:hypothetical protein